MRSNETTVEPMVMERMKQGEMHARQSDSPGRIRAAHEIGTLRSNSSVDSSPRKDSTKDAAEYADVDGIVEKASQLESEMDNLELKKQQLLHDQWRLLHASVDSMNMQMTELRDELEKFKAHALAKELELEKFKAHALTKDLMEQRIVGLQRLIEDNAERHLTDLSQHKTLTERLFDTELVAMKQQVEKHSKDLSELKATMDMDEMPTSKDLSAREAKMEQRLEFLHGLLDVNADKHGDALSEHKNSFSDHKATVGKRLKYIEATLMEFTEISVKERSTDRKLLNDLHDHVAACAKLGKRTDTRMDYLEKLVRESFLEVADKHTKDFTTVHAKLDGLAADVMGCSRVETQLSLLQRLDSLESFVEASAGKTESMKKLYEENKASMEDRYDKLNRFFEISVERQAKAMEVAEGRIEALCAAGKASVPRHDALENRAKNLEKHFANETARMSSYEERLREASLHMNTTEGRLRELEHKHAGLQSFTSKCSMKEEVSNINALVSGKVESAEVRVNLAERLVLDASDDLGRRLSVLEGRVYNFENYLKVNAQRCTVRADGVSCALPSSPAASASSIPCAGAVVTTAVVPASPLRSISGMSTPARSRKSSSSASPSRKSYPLRTSKGLTCAPPPRVCTEPGTSPRSPYNGPARAPTESGSPRRLGSASVPIGSPISNISFSLSGVSGASTAAGVPTGESQQQQGHLTTYGSPKRGVSAEIAD